MIIGHAVAEHLVDFSQDRAGAVAYHMLKGFVLAVNVGKKMLGAFG